jgi:hypothetical protein
MAPPRKPFLDAPARAHPTSAESSPEKVSGYIFVEPLGGWH